MKKKKKEKPAGAKDIIFPSMEDLHANLIIKLNFDDITKFFFFNEYIKAYLNEDKELMPFVEKVKEKSMLSRKFRTKKARQAREKEKEMINRFRLDLNDVEDIFDLIEREET